MIFFRLFFFVLVPCLLFLYTTLMSDPTIQEIKEKLSIVDVVRSYIPLQQAGKNFKAICPFHKEKAPSFVVSPDRGTWHCFGSCNEGGDIFSFVMKYENVEFYEALSMLAQKAGVELKRLSPSSQKEFGVLYDIQVAAKDFFVASLADHQEALSYLESRGIGGETKETFEIGFAPNAPDGLLLHLVNMGYDVSDIERSGLVFKTDRGTYIDRFRGRIIFPLYNTFGKVIAFSGRILPSLDTGTAGKYINSPETPVFNKSHLLYGLHITKKEIREVQRALLVEGPMDFLMAWQEGVRNGVAVSGTALTTHHLETLRKYADSLLLGFDSDSAGAIAMERAIDMANIMDFSVSVLLLPEGKDIAEYVLSHPKELAHIIHTHTVSAVDFYFKRYLDGKGDVPLTRRIRPILEKLLHIKSPLERSRWVRLLSEREHIVEHALYDELTLLERASKKNEPTQKEKQEISLGNAVVFADRYEGIAGELLAMGAGVGKAASILLGWEHYFPPRFECLARFVSGADETTLSADDEKLLAFFEMQATLKHDNLEQDQLLLAMQSLLRDLKKEFLVMKRTQLKQEIEVAEKANDAEHLSKLLKEFDETAKLINNT